MKVKNTFNPGIAKNAMLGAGGAYARALSEKLLQFTQEEAPVDTGAMRDSATVVNADGMSGNLTAALEATVSTQGTSGSVAYRVQVLEMYAPFVEMGHYTKSGSWVPPNPFMRRALARVKDMAGSIAASISLKAFAGAFGAGQQAQHPTGQQQRDFQIGINTAIPSPAEPPVG